MGCCSDLRLKTVGFRLFTVKRWVEYIESKPPETWGPQQNAVVDDQLEAAQSGQTSASHYRHVKDVATELIEASDDSGDDSGDDSEL